MTAGRNRGGASSLRTLAAVRVVASADYDADQTVGLDSPPATLRESRAADPPAPLPRGVPPLAGRVARDQERKGRHEKARFALLSRRCRIGRGVAGLGPDNDIVLGRHR